MTPRLDIKNPMQPKFNKLITLLLLLGTFAFLLEAEQRIMSFARINISDWASLLPMETTAVGTNSINHYTQKTSLTDVSILASLRPSAVLDIPHLSHIIWPSNL